MKDNRYQREVERNTKRLEQVKQKKVIYDQRLQIHEIKKEMRRYKPPTTTKMLIAFILSNCTAVEIYSMVAMWHLEDLSALYALIGAVVTEGFSFAVYCAKAYKETQQAEVISLERYKLDNGYTEEETVPDRAAAMG